MIILITWVNHHNALKLVIKTSTPFIYANRFLLITVAFIPFPTTLMGEYISTDHAAPAVIMYNTVLALQACGWILICQTAMKNKLCTNEKAIQSIRKNGKFEYFAFMLYSICFHVCHLVSLYVRHYYHHHLDFLADIWHQY